MEEQSGKRLAGAVRQGKPDMPPRVAVARPASPDALTGASRATAWRRISDEDDTRPPDNRPALSLGNPDLVLEGLARGVPELEYREWAGVRTGGIAVAVIGALLIIVGLAADAGWGTVAALPWGVAFVMLGGSAALLLSVLPGRTVAEPLETQAMEWDAASSHFHRINAWARRCAIVATVGLLLLGGALVFLPAWGILHGALGFLMVAAGVVWGILASRRGPLRLALRQTLLLRELESRGLMPAGVMDPSVRDVMLALDQLLGDLPDSAVQRFLASEESGTFLGLLAEIRGK